MIGATSLSADDDEKASSDTGADNVQDRGQKDAPSKVS